MKIPLVWSGGQAAFGVRWLDSALSACGSDAGLLRLRPRRRLPTRARTPNNVSGAFEDKSLRNVRVKIVDKPFGRRLGAPASRRQ